MPKPKIVASNKIAKPVWVTGTLLKRTSSRITIRTTDVREKPRDATIPIAHVQREEASGGISRFCVPQWWAYQQKVQYSES